MEALGVKSAGNKKRGRECERDAVQTVPNRSKTAHSPEYNIRNIIEKDVLNEQ